MRHLTTIFLITWSMVSMGASWRPEDVKNFSDLSIVLIHPSEAREWVRLSRKREGKTRKYGAALYTGQRALASHSVKTELFDLLHGELYRFWNRELSVAKHPQDCRPKTKILVQAGKKTLYDGFVCNDHLLPTSERELAALYRYMRLAATQK